MTPVNIVAPAEDASKAGRSIGSVVPPTLHPKATVSWIVVRWKLAPESPDTPMMYVKRGVEVIVENVRLKLTI